MKTFLSEHQVEIAITLLVLTVIVAFGWMLVDSQQQIAESNFCLRAGYADYQDFAGMRYCYRLSGERGELVSVESLRKEAK